MVAKVDTMPCFLASGEAMRRREFISGFAMSTVLSPFASRAQQSPKPVIGYLSSKGGAAEAGIVAAMRGGLAERGFIEGRSFEIVYHYSDGHYDRLPKLANDLVDKGVKVIGASGLPATLAAKKATSKIPIVFRLAVDPVAFGLAKSLDHPGGNLTGVTMLFDPLTPKKLQLLHELTPHVNSVGLLVNPNNPNAASHKERAETGTQALGLHLTVLTAGSAGELEGAFATGREKNVGAILVGDDPLFDVENERLVKAAASSGIPTMYYVRDFAIAGGLISYGPSFDEMAKQVGVYLGRILGGEKANDLPIQQPTKIELVINRKAAQTLGITVPRSLLDRADVVIE